MAKVRVKEITDDHVILSNIQGVLHPPKQEYVFITLTKMKTLLPKKNKMNRVVLNRMTCNNITKSALVACQFSVA